MYLLYADESGDTGITKARHNPFMLSALLVHESDWNGVLDHTVQFRRYLKPKYGLKTTDEFHASKLMADTNIDKGVRLGLLREYASFLGGLPAIRIIAFSVDKTKLALTTDVFDFAWKVLIQRFENSLGDPAINPTREKGILITDETNSTKLRKLQRKLRRYNPIPNNRAIYSGGSRNLPINRIIEDPIMRDSVYSFFIQSVDVIAYLVRQHLQPSSFMKQYRGNKLFARHLEIKTIPNMFRNNDHGIGLL